MRKGFAGLAVVGCIAAVTGTAAASPRAPERELTDARDIAVAKWGGTCTGPVTVRFHALRSDTLGMARWAGMWDIPPDERDDCQIWLNSRKKWNWARLCTTVVHEYGHLAGHDHSHQGDSPMHASYTRAYRGCTSARAARRWAD